jgi:hypothetical protein
MPLIGLPGVFGNSVTHSDSVNHLLVGWDMHAAHWSTRSIR